MKYTKEIDGLRAISVILVILFHANSAWVPGGYIGVDVFFVISGFLITSLIQNEINRTGKFSFINFYNRRFARLLPALIVTLAVTYSFGFLLYGPAEFDSLGRDIFFSALGVKNFLDAMGANYFVQDETFKPLLHMWSLGVEEQYYVVWPLVLLLTAILFRSLAVFLSLVLLVLFLGVSEFGATQNLQGAYFLPQYRAVELLVGSSVALIMISKRAEAILTLPYIWRSTLSSVSFAALIFLAFSFNSQTEFPGSNALLVAIPSIILILFSQGTPIGWILSRKLLVGIGLISYPLYLYHQPLISFTLFFDHNINRLLLLALVVSFGSLLAYGTYVFVETPMRQRAKTSSGKWQATCLFALTISIAGGGAVTAKLGGIPQRLSMLNPYAYSLSQSLRSSFHENFNRGVHTGGAENPKILFVGDSLLQQYVQPLVQHWGYSLDQIDVISRGGCVLLKEVDYADKFSDISCDQLRADLYKSDQRYEKIVFSQGWDLYGKKVLNASAQPDVYGPDTWKPFIEKTADHFSKIADKVFVIGPHPKIIGDCDLKVSPITTKESALACLKNMKIDKASLLNSTRAFNQSLGEISAKVLFPIELWCEGEDANCSHYENEQPYFRDREHFGVAATELLVKRMQDKGW
ncbi:acyltransferase family protein [Pseudovibrio sp. POLY-S9]|uniref:acyltransferase family protein n=1 Tax=Pseudovibrio sp. POLY-S9 TaxID=1576596 RepID=UPI00070D3917|nr:acyltransferase family protein [Pseudovibrio sp. POLY-S9]